MRIFITVITLLFPFLLVGQCPTTGLTLTTQAEVDAFPTTYPGCTSMTTSLTIDGTAIVNLNGLSALTSIGGTLYIKNTMVPDLSGLTNLVSVTQWIEIENNDLLTNVDGLSNMKSSLSSLTIKGNAILANLNGFIGLNTASGITNSSFQLTINENPQLISITGVSTITGTVGAIYIQNNLLLPNLQGIHNVTSVGNTLWVEKNPELISWNLPNITTVNQFWCIDNDKIPNFNQFSNVTGFPGGLYIDKNAIITNLVGLENATVAGQIRIRENPELLTVGLSSLTTGTSIYITDNAKLTSLGGLSNLTSATSGLQIQNNIALMDINLTSLTTVNGQFLLFNSPNLGSLSGLNMLATVTSDFWMDGLSNLTDISGLSSLTSTKGLRIENANMLTTLSGLQNLTTLDSEYLSIKNNALLTDISAIQNIVYTTIKTLEIANNAALSTCNITNVCSYIGVTANSATTSISGNLTTCVDVAAVQLACCGANPPPPPTFSGLSNTTTTGADQTLIGSPTGGTFSGTGITGNVFSPSSAGSGTHTISYKIDCADPVTQQVIVALANCNTPPTCITLTVSSGLPIAIPATVGEGLPAIFNQMTDISLTDVNVIGIVGTHQYGNEVRFSLESPSGNKKYILYNNCTGSSGFNLTIDDTFSDFPSSDCGTTSAAVSGKSKDASGNQTLDSFNGENGKGTWKFYAEDSVNGDGGAITGVTIQVCGSMTPITFDVQDSISQTAPAITLTATPSGGTFTGMGVSGNTFNPSGLPLGNQIINYSVIDPNCNAITLTAKDTIKVVAVTGVTASITSSDPDNAICSGASITLTASGGTTYAWSSGETTAAITKMPIATATYTVTVTDANGSTGTASQIVTINPAPNATITTNDSDNILCSGESIILTASGGGTYAWSTGETTAVISKMPTASTTYTVTVTSTAGCVATASQAVTINPAATAVITSSDTDNALCSGASIILTASGGTSYAWSSGETTAAITKLPTATATYTVTVTSSSGCTGTASQIVTINPAPNAAITTNDSDNMICSGESIILTASGGGTYVWSSGETTAAITKMPTANSTYTVTVTGTNMCTATAMQAVTIASGTTTIGALMNTTTAGANQTITGTPAGGTFSGPGVTGTIFSPSIAGVGTHTITHTVTTNGCTTNATTMVTVTLDNCATPPTCVTVDATTMFPIAIPTTASSGTYHTAVFNNTQQLTITDVNLISITGTHDVKSDLKMHLVSPTGTFKTVFAQTCGGGGAFDFTLDDAYNSPPANDCGASGNLLSVSQNFGDVRTLLSFNGENAVGEWKFHVEDLFTGDGGSLTGVQLQICGSPTPIAITAPDSLCQTAAAVTLTATPSGGAFVGSGISGSTFDPSGLSVGSYPITYSVMDPNCNAITLNTSDTIKVVASTSNAMIASNDTDNTICAGESITLTASGGGTYAWSSGETTAAIMKSPSNTTTYTVTVTNTAGCIATAMQAVTVNPAATATITSSDTDNTICAGEAITLTAAGGATYAWSSGETTAAIMKMPTANTAYTVTVTNTNGCTASSMQTVIVNSLPLASISSSDMDNEICSGASITLTSSGGSGYSWSTGETDAAITKMPTTNTTYTVTVTNVNGCTSTSAQSVTVNEMPTITISSVDCAMDLMSYSVMVSTTDVDVLATTAGTVTGSGNAYTISNIPINTNITLTGTNNTTMCNQTLMVNSPNCSCPTITPPVGGGNQEICVGQSNPAVSATVGTGLQVNWYDMASGGTLLLANNINYTPTVMAVGTYTYYAEAFDASNNCMSDNRTEVLLTINALPGASIISDDTDNEICAGTTIMLTASGGNMYAWSSGETTASITKMPSANTTYTVTVTGTDGCTNTAAQTVFVNSVPTANITSSELDNTICLGESATLTASGGDFYLWSAGETTASVMKSPNTTTIYSVTVTNAEGCSDVTTKTINVNPLPIASIISSDTDNSICNGSSITLTANGGVSYNWSTGETVADITKTPATTTTYSVTVTDINGCSSTSNQEVTVNPLPVLTTSMVTCASNLLTYSIELNTTFVDVLTTNSGQITGGGNMWTISNIASGSDVTLTGTNNTTGCSTQLVVAAPDCSCPMITSPVSGGDQTICFGQPTPAVSATVGAGLQINWYDMETAGTLLLANNTSYTAPSSVAESFTYYAEAIDPINNCTSVSRTAVTLTINAVPTVAIGSDDSDNTICNSSSITLTATGGGTYVWSSGESIATITKMPMATTTYSVTVTAANGCTNTATQQVTVNALPTSSITSTDSDNTICSGENLTLTASGGASYIWSSGETIAAITKSPTATTTYTVTVTDANGCTAASAQEITVNPLPVAVISSDDTDNAICTGSTITLTATGGSGYTWSTGETLASITKTPTINTTYTVTVTNTSGCTSTNTQEVVVNPLPILATTSVDCSTDLTTYSIQVNTTLVDALTTTAGQVTGTGNSYTISGIPSGINVILTGTNNTTMCTQSIAVNSPNCSCPTVNAPINQGNQDICFGQANPVLSMTVDAGLQVYWYDMPAGGNLLLPNNLNYTPTVTAAGGYVYYAEAVNPVNNCVSTTRTAISLTINALPIATITSSDNDNTICIGDDITLTAIGGTSYTWNNGQSTAEITINPTTNTTYTVTVTDANGCTNTASQNVVVNPLPIVTISSSDTDNTICTGESITLTSSNGASYAWSSGETSNSISVSPTANTTYTVTVTSTEGCSNSALQVVVVNPTPIATISSSDADNTLCEGETVSLTAAGGASYIWSTGENVATISKVPTSNTNYTVTVTNTNGCTSVANQNIVVNPLPVVTITSTDTDNTVCNGSSVTLTATGGSTYVWSTGATQSSITVSPTMATTYTVTATDNSGCFSTGMISMDAHPLTVAIINSSDADNTICESESVTLTASGGSVYAWSNGSSSAEISVQPTQTTQYQVTVTDVNGCTATADQVIVVNPLPTATITSTDADDTICEGSTVILTAAQSGSYAWSTGQTSQQISVSPTVSTTYTVTVTNTNGCTNTAANSIIVNTLPIAGITSDDADNTICTGSSIQLTGSGGNSYAWSNGANTATISLTPTANTIYTVTVTDGNQCSSAAEQIVVLTPLPLLTLADAACSADLMSWSVSISTDATATVSSSAGSVSGGNTAYQVTGIPANTNIVVTSTDNNSGCVTTQNIASPNCSCPNIDLPTNPINQTICEGSTPAALMVTVPTGISVNWYDASTGGTQVQANSNSYTPMNTAVGSYTYYAEAINTVNSCVSLGRTAVIYTIENVPTGSISSGDSDNIICSGESVVLTANGGSTYSWSSNESSQSITVTPEMTTTYMVTITGSNGCTNTASQVVTVNSLPIVSVTTDQTDDKICVGDSITLTAAGGTTYAWAGMQTSNNIKVSPAITTTYMVTVTNDQGCSAITSKEVIVGVIPDAAITSSDTDNIICEEETVTLTAIGGASYAWSTNATSADIMVTPLTTITYVVTVTSIDGCSSTATTSIMVNPKATASITTDDADNTICRGDSIAITAAGGGTYIWNNGSSLASIKVAPIETTSYTVTVTNGNGCTALGSQEVILHPEPTIVISNVSCSDDLNTYSVIVTTTNVTMLTATLGTVTGSNGNYTLVGVPKGESVSLTAINTTTGCMVSQEVLAPNCDCPAVEAAVSGGNQSICSGIATPGLSVTTSGTLVADWYDNETGGIVLSTGITFTPPVTAAGIYNYYIETRDPVNTCISATRTLVVLTILESPQGSIMTNDADNTICNGNEVTLSAGGGSTYIWSNAATSNDITVSPTMETTYSVTITGTTGCTDTVTQLVNVNSIPAVNIVVPDTVCSGVTFDLIENGGDANTWNWSVNGTTTDKGDTLIVQGGTLTNPEISLIVTDANGCTNSSQQTLNITESPIFQSEFLIASSACQGDSVKIIEHSDINFTPEKVRWDFGDGNTSSETYPTHVFTAAGSYNVKVTIWNSDCSSTSIEKTVDVKNCRIVATGENVILNVYPNPLMNNGTIHISGESSIRQPVLITLSDAYGKIMYRERLEDELIFDLAKELNIPAGVYVLRIDWMLSKEMKIRKLMIVE